MSNENWTKGEWACKEPNGKWFSDHDWSVDNHELGGYSNVAVHCDGVVIALIVDSDGGDNMLSADAHLIAAAPDLYEALDKIARRIDANDVDEWTLHALKNIAWEALAKADGE